jgi:broad-specificity NMP kinase
MNYNVLYKGRKIYTNVTAEDCSDILQDLSESFYSEDLIDLELNELEETYGNQK